MGVCVLVVGIGEVVAFFKQLTLLSSKTKEDEVMDAQEFINFEFEFYLNTPCELLMRML